MTTNAPYYGLRGGHGFSNTVNGQTFGQAPDELYETSSMTPNTPHFYHDAAHAQPHSSDNQSSYNAQTAVDSSLEENHNLVELLEAANTAAGHATEALAHGRATETQAQQAPHDRGKRKRTSSPGIGDNGNTNAPKAYGEEHHIQKRARQFESNGPTDPQLSTPAEQIQHSQDAAVAPQSNDGLLNDARAAGVHSAAALFRRSSNNQAAKKYTRPPMSKLFMSLQLTPENFLHLQAQAKAYMLDPAYPERQNCVGNRGKGDTDMVKLRLFNCVRDFLNAGAGEQFFGENVDKPGEKEAIEAAKALGENNVQGNERRMVWPYDGNTIIGLVTPLLRRMVTNERQRQYAIETRKGGGRRKENSVEATPSAQENEFTLVGVEHNVSHSVPELERLTHLDPALPDSPAQGQAQHSFTPFQAPSLAHHYPPNPPALEVPMRMESYDMQTFEERPLPERFPVLHTISIFLTWKGAKLGPKYDVTHDATEYTFAALQREIRLVVRQAQAFYPSLRPKPGMGPELLRGLAAAATEMGVRNENPRGDAAPSNPHDNQPRPSTESAASSMAVPASDAASPTASIRALPPTPAPGSERPSADLSATPSIVNKPLPPIPGSPDPVSPPKSQDSRLAIQSPSSAFAPTDIPKYDIRVLTAQGLVVVENEEQWGNAKTDVSLAAWAEGVVRVVIEFV
ncbi:hypothetical protein GQ43DRAFT_168469 [Delitschia confertaspora ATCC 74209]|uniref:Uncharacterized protein n=1 Tax=Delitschia confertaspora ATCC 74209 TaxID=1513339 RepID=A0A9P4JHV6_9PLEO|nr:hypothetical protein GQ43DRAFT_168469 [Delitschia confertaspora ATCC 74209]